MKRLIPLLLLIYACSPRIQPPDADALKPSWLKDQPYRAGYYTGVGHSIKDGSNNYIQAAKKSALDDLISQIKVNVASTSILSFFETGQKVREDYEQIIKTTAAEELEEFELVDAWEDPTNYWVYYQLSISRYHQIKEEQKRNATLLAKDYFSKGLGAEQAGHPLQAISFYFQAFRSIEKYLGEPIRTTIGDREVLLVNEIYASIQKILRKISLQVNPAEVLVNRRLAQSEINVVAKASFEDSSPASGLPLTAYFEKGSGEIYPDYKTNDDGEARVLMTRISSVDTEQRVGVKVNIDALSGTSSSPVYSLIAKTFNVPGAHVLLKVQRPLVFLSSEERSLGFAKSNEQISNKLKNLLMNNGFEFTTDKNAADLWFDIQADSEKGSVSGSIYITYLTGVIKVTALKEGKEIYATTLDRVKGYGLDYAKSSVDAYNKAMESLERERLEEILDTVLQ
ncbi:MAG TPA: LPP20 family lipoprotein [Chryseosolibacter sp.]